MAIFSTRQNFLEIATCSSRSIYFNLKYLYEINFYLWKSIQFHFLEAFVRSKVDHYLWFANEELKSYWLARCYRKSRGGNQKLTINIASSLLNPFIKLGYLLAPCLWHTHRCKTKVHETCSCHDCKADVHLLNIVLWNRFLFGCAVFGATWAFCSCSTVSSLQSLPWFWSRGSRHKPSVGAACGLGSSSIFGVLCPGLYFTPTDILFFLLLFFLYTPPFFTIKLFCIIFLKHHFGLL